MAVSVADAINLQLRSKRHNSPALLSLEYPGWHFTRWLQHHMFAILPCVYVQTLIMRRSPCCAEYRRKCSWPFCIVKCGMQALERMELQAQLLLMCRPPVVLCRQGLLVWQNSSERQSFQRARACHAFFLAYPAGPLLDNVQNCVIFKHDAGLIVFVR